MPSEFVPVPKEFIGDVIGKGGCIIQDISQRSGAQVRSPSSEEEGFTVSGNAVQIAWAKRLILKIVLKGVEKKRYKISEVEKTDMKMTTLKVQSDLKKCEDIQTRAGEALKQLDSDTMSYYQREKKALLIIFGCHVVTGFLGHAIAAGTGSVAPRAGIEWVFLDLVCAWVVISTIIMESDAILDGEVGGDYTHSFFLFALKQLHWHTMSYYQRQKMEAWIMFGCSLFVHLVKGVAAETRSEARGAFTILLLQDLVTALACRAVKIIVIEGGGAILDGGLGGDYTHSSFPFRPQDRSQDNAKPEETHPGATPENPFRPQDRSQDNAKPEETHPGATPENPFRPQDRSQDDAKPEETHPRATPENPFRPQDRSQDDAKPEETHPGATPENPPPEILARGTLALEAYNNALAEGNAHVKRVPLMLIGQDRSGKTSLKKSLKGIVFDPDEDSTVGIDVDQYHFEVTTEIWMTGKKEEESTTDGEAISFEHNAARLVAERLMEVGNVIRSKRAAYVGSENYGLEMTETPIETQPRESSTGPEPIYSHKPDPPAGEVSNSTERSPEGDAVVMTQVQMPNFEDISVITETLLKDGIAENSGDIHSIMWDFAGQSVYYATHPLFLTARAIYLLAYDLSEDPYDIARPVVKQGVYKEIQDNFNQKTNLDYLDFWLASVASLASQDKYKDIDLKSEVLPKQLPAVFLVCTHADQPHNGCDPFKLAREIFGTLKSKPYGAQLFDVFVVDNTKSGSGSECQEVMRLREVVLAAAKELPHVNEVVPIKWLKYEKALEMLKNNGHKWISLAQAKHVMSKVCSINGDDEMLTLLNFLHDLRLLIHFDDTKELNDVVVLDPQWLIDVFKEVITVRPYSSKDKRFVDLWCKLERDGILEEKLLKHVWSSLITRTETFECLIAIMEKFILLCLLPFHVDGSRCKQYLVPSMLKSHPPNTISDLVAPAQIPSLFLRFETGQVPAGYFPRLVLEFFQWCTDKFPRQEPPQLPQLFDGFARFYILPEEGLSVVLLCHSLSIELLLLTSDETFDTSDGNWACAVRNNLASMIECMQNKFFWVKNVACVLNFLCPVCCRGREVSYCRTHHAVGCKQEECLHFFPASKLATGDKQVFCDRSATAQENRVSVTHFAPWFPSEHGKELSSAEHDGRLLTSVPDELPERSPATPCNVLESLQPVDQLEAGHGIADESTGEFLPFLRGHCGTSLALPCEILTTLQTQLYTPENVVDKLLQNLQLEQESLKQPEPGTKELIRCLARNANSLNRLDVVEHLRQVTPAGTTGPLLPETLAVRNIPPAQIRSITVSLSGGEEWKLVAEKLGLTPDEIRFLDKRTLNPAKEMLEYIIAYKYPHITAGQLYDVLTACGVPVLADLL